MHRLVRRSSIAAISVFTMIVLGGSTASACGTGSNNQTNVTVNSSASSQVTTSLSTLFTGGGTTASSQTNANDLWYMLDVELREHAMLAVDLLKAQHLQEPDLQALQTAVEANNQAIAGTIDQLYPGTQDKFLQLWRSHTGYYQQYLTASEQSDTASRQQAMQNLANFAADTANLLGDANPRLDRANLQQQIVTHGSQTISITDNLVAGNYTTVYQLAHQDAEHMDMVATAVVDR